MSDEIEETNVGQKIYDSAYIKSLTLSSNEITLNNGTNNTLKLRDNVIEGVNLLINGQTVFNTRTCR